MSCCVVSLGLLSLAWLLFLRVRVVAVVAAGQVAALARPVAVVGGYDVVFLL